MFDFSKQVNSATVALNPCPIYCDLLAPLFELSVVATDASYQLELFIVYSTLGLGDDDTLRPSTVLEETRSSITERKAVR